MKVAKVRSFFLEHFGFLTILFRLLPSALLRSLELQLNLPSLWVTMASRTMALFTMQLVGRRPTRQ